MSRGDVTYHDLIARNRRNSVLLVVGFVLFVGILVGVLAGGLLHAEPSQALLVGGAAVAVAGLISAWSYYGGGKAILAMSGAAPLDREDDPALYNVVEEIAIAAGIPKPSVYRIDDSALNAFATGRDPAHAAVAITRGLRERLSRDELQAVIAHEISHVRNYDIRLTMLLATLVGMVVLITDFFWRTLRFGAWTGAGRRRGGSRKGGAGGGAAVMFLVAILLSIVAPAAARLIQMAASRQREYLADAGAVELTRNPEAMISALRKLGGDKEVLEAANRATAHLYIVQPIKRWEKRAKGFLSSHPPLESRIARLEQLLDHYLPQGESR